MLSFERVFGAACCYIALMFGALGVGFIEHKLSAYGLFPLETTGGFIALCMVAVAALAAVIGLFAFGVWVFFQHGSDRD